MASSVGIIVVMPRRAAIAPVTAAGRVAGHGAGVAEREVDVLVAVDVGDPGAAAWAKKSGNPPDHSDHPGHRHAHQEVLAGALGERGAARVAAGEGRPLVGEQALEGGTVGHGR